MNRRRHRQEGGQMLVVFALSLMVLVAFAGLSVDAGGTFAQRRDEQTAADLASLAGANDYLVNGDSTLAIARARSVATNNGFTDGTNGAVVGVSVDTSNGVQVTVDLTAPHTNTFLGALGMPKWNVSTTSAALAGFPDSAMGAGPFIFSIGAFDNAGTPRYQTETDFGESNGDVPTSAIDMAWTDYSGEDNVNTTEVSDIISGGEVVDKTLSYGQYIGQHNQGNHTSLYGDVDTYLSGVEMPVAVVDNAGTFMGWAMFHVTSADQGSHHIRGYFLSSFISAKLRVSSCAANACPRYLGSYVLKLSG
jgi:Flp pilus assembly protein TadG